MKDNTQVTGRFRQYGVSLLLIQLAMGCSPSQPQSNEAGGAADIAAAGDVAPLANAALPADARLIVAFGDSLYAGYGLAQGEGFAPSLQRSLIAKGIKAQVVNAGVSGDTSAGGLNRLGFVLGGLPRKPDLVIVGLGGNDMLRGLDPAKTRANLDAILTELKKRGIATMLTGMLASPNMGGAYAATFNAIYPDLARAYDVPLYPFFLDGVIGHPDLQLPDGVHPNARGVAGIVARVTPAVAKSLPE